MAIQFDLPLARWEDGILTVALDPPTPIAGWDLRFKVQKRFGIASGLIEKVSSSGFVGGQSGITVVNSGAGVINIAINKPDTSGLAFGNYACSVQRVNSGFQTALSQGFLILYPDIGD